MKLISGYPFLCIALLSGCSSIEKQPPHAGEMIAGCLELYFEIPDTDKWEGISFTVIADLEKRSWPGQYEKGENRWCIYSITAQHLQLELQEKISEQTGFSRGAHAGEREWLDDQWEGMSIQKMLIFIEGDFERRDQNSVYGVFRGTAEQEFLTGAYIRQEQEWRYNTRPGWRGWVTGHCLLDGERVERLPIRRVGGIDR